MEFETDFYLAYINKLSWLRCAFAMFRKPSICDESLDRIYGQMAKVHFGRRQLVGDRTNHFKMGS
jgi:hypothetical protein